MQSIRSLSARARSYVASVTLLGGTALLVALGQLLEERVDLGWFVLVGLTVLISSITVKVPSVAATLSVSEAFVFSSVILYGWAAGVVLASVDGLVVSYWLQHRKPQPHYRVVFNATAPALATGFAAWVYATSGAPNVLDPGFEIKELLGPLLAFATTYFLANTALIAVAISLEQGLEPFNLWRNNFLSLWLNFFSGASIAALLVSFGTKGGANALGAIWVVLPLLGISHFTYKSSMARIEDANKHVDQLNTLYLSTIETLAMAIDAKDQITHGHIRRVQTFAVALAKEVGITDALQIRAIEAAALLHDMGKLAVPEYILNKPGPLTPAEFERMKLHAAAGADILSAIDFPYPVVPIVRHHHENWDGSGYPAGLKGTDIPIGARVLSVVDCFDALTSDRPYRPRLSDEEALQVVTDRRGRMYDPLIVDSFLRLYARMKSQHAEVEGSAASQIHSLPRVSTSSPRLAAITASAGESRAMYRLIQRLAAQPTLDGALNDVAEEIASLIPATAVAIYTPATDNSEFEAKHVYGAHSDWIRGRKAHAGQRIVGWSASSGRSVLNADASGELGEVARVQSSAFRNCMTVPITVRGERLGVIAAFSSDPVGFRGEDQRIAEAVVKHVAPVLERLRSQGATALSTERDLELTPPAMIACRCGESRANMDSIGMALAAIRQHLGQQSITQIVSANDVFTTTAITDVEAVERAAEGIRSSLLTLGIIESRSAVAVATTPKDGTNLEHLLYTCRQRLNRQSESQRFVH